MKAEDVSLRRIAEISVLAVVLIIGLVMVAYAIPSLIGASHSYIILSDSMNPTVSAGDVVFIYETQPETIEEGDIITYGGRSDRPTTHRVIQVVQEDNEVAFRTKGDANEDPDRYVVPGEAVIGYVPVIDLPAIGTVPVHIPEVGRFILFAGTKMGIALFVFIPVALLILGEVYEIGQEIMKARNSEKAGQANPSEGEK